MKNRIMAIGLMLLTLVLLIPTTTSAAPATPGAFISCNPHPSKPYVASVPAGYLRFRGVAYCNYSLPGLSMKLHAKFNIINKFETSYYVASSQKWHCGPCQQIGPHSFTVWPSPGRGYYWTEMELWCPSCNVIKYTRSHSKPCYFNGEVCW